MLDKFRQIYPSFKANGFKQTQINFNQNKFKLRKMVQEKTIYIKLRKTNTHYTLSQIKIS